MANSSIPKWAHRRVSFNLAKTHTDMLDTLVAERRKLDRRENQTSVIEDAIENLYQITHAK